MRLAKRDKEWLSGLALHLRMLAQALERGESTYDKEEIPSVLRKIAEVLERTGAGKL